MTKQHLIIGIVGFVFVQIITAFVLFTSVMSSFDQRMDTAENNIQQIVKGFNAAFNPKK